MKEINWESDIEQLKIQLPKVHAKQFENNCPEFYDRITSLKQNLENLRMFEIVIELAKIVATIKDAHTAIIFPNNYRIPFDCFIFSEGICITDTDEDNKDLINCKITAIEKMPIKLIFEKISEIISHENMQFVRSSFPELLVCVDILYGMNIISNPQKVLIALENREGQTFQRSFKPIKYNDYIKLDIIKENLPLYRQNSDKYYWSNFDDGLFYINYSKCKNMEYQTVASFCETLKYFVENNKIEKIVIDLRKNTGGDSELFRPFLVWLVHTNLIAKGIMKLFVIIGRDTFSSALLNTYLIHFESNAIFVGEPTGGKPNCYGEVKYFELESSGLMIRYSTRYYKLIDDDNLLTFSPDVNFKVSLEDYLNLKDPCLEYIKKSGTCHAYRADTTELQ